MDPRARKCLFVGYSATQKGKLIPRGASNTSLQGEIGSKEEEKLSWDEMIIPIVFRVEITPPTPSKLPEERELRVYARRKKNQGQDALQDSQTDLTLEQDQSTASPENIEPEAFANHLSFVSTPDNLQNALGNPKWKSAMVEEMEALQKNSTWDLVELPEGKKNSANLDWPLQQFDVNNAFLHGELEEEVYMDLPPGFTTASDVGKVCNDEEGIRRLRDYLAKEFEMKDLGALRYFLGIEVARSRHGIFLSQRKYVLDLLTETGMLACKPIDTPIEQNHKLGDDRVDQVPTNKERYQRLVGRLIYLSHTRPDLAYAVSVVSQFMHSPNEVHMDAVHRILRYLKSASSKGLMFSKHGHLEVEGYTDVDWVGSITDRKSTSGYFTFVGGNLVTWRSKKQNVVARSSAEAEYRAVSHGLCELLWLRILMGELGFNLEKPVNLYCDNKAAISIAHNPV
uniref:Reverse transcriptase Ty1/copia-type domain-containing protein n=1 Tax=Fagus sylvatica TaxID=28930 RepID=A0A2N9EWH5_FAGSY